MHALEAGAAGKAWAALGERRERAPELEQKKAGLPRSRGRQPASPPFGPSLVQGSKSNAARSRRAIRHLPYQP
jgi:hypothetical protein